MSSGGGIRACYAAPPSRPSTSSLPFTEHHSNSKHWPNRDRSDDAASPDAQRSSHNGARMSPPAANARVPSSASRMARLRHLEEKLGGFRGRRNQSGRSRVTSLDDILPSEDLLRSSRSSNTLLSPRLPSDLKPDHSFEAVPHMRHRSKHSPEPGQHRPLFGRHAGPARKQNSKSCLHCCTASSDSAEHWDLCEEKDRNQALGIAKVERSKSVDGIVTRSLGSLLEVEWDNTPDGDIPFCKKTDPAFDGFLSAWEEKDPCSLVTRMANQVYPQPSQAHDEAQRQAIFDALGLSSTVHEPAKPRRQNSKSHRSSHMGKEQTSMQHRTSSPAPDLALKTQGCESVVERLSSPCKSNKGQHAGLQELADDEIRPHRNSGSSSAIMRDESPAEMLMSSPPPLLYSSDSSHYAQWQDTNSLQPIMQQAHHHYLYATRADAEFQRVTRQCMLTTTAIHGHRAQTMLTGGDLGRFPVRKLVPPEEHHYQGISSHATCPSFVPSRPPMQSETRNHPGHLHVPSRKGTASVSPYSASNDNHSLFDSGRGRPYSRPLASAPNPVDRAIHSHLRTFGNPQPVPLMMARSSSSIPSQGPSRPLAVPAGSLCGGVPVRDATDWPAMIMGSKGVVGIRQLGRPMVSS